MPCATLAATRGGGKNCVSFAAAGSTADWRTECNTYRPHSALDKLSPAEFAAQWRHTNQPQLS